MHKNDYHEFPIEGHEVLCQHPSEFRGLKCADTFTVKSRMGRKQRWRIHRDTLPELVFEGTIPSQFVCLGGCLGGSPCKLAVIRAWPVRFNLDLCCIIMLNNHFGLIIRTRMSPY
jgi:hypothetical protein